MIPQDYFPLYLGCRYVSTVPTVPNGIIAGFSVSDICDFVDVRFPYVGPEGMDEITIPTNCFDKIKPILRPLSDMTDAEARHIEEEWGSGWVMGDHYLTDTLKDNQLAYVKKLGESFHLFHYLLSLHFDLFGLIASGLAIDKTTLKA